MEFHSHLYLSLFVLELIINAYYQCIISTIFHMET